MRISPLVGETGLSSDGPKPFRAAMRCFISRAWLSLIIRLENFLPNTMGASEVVSEPAAIAQSICPVAILAPSVRAACRLVPQACCNVIPGVSGDNLLDSTASRARLKSREWVITAPAISSSICSPARSNLSTRPSIAADSISRLLLSA